MVVSWATDLHGPRIHTDLHGSCSGTWNPEPGTRNPEPGTRNLAEPREPCATEPGGTRWNLEEPRGTLVKAARRDAAGGADAAGGVLRRSVVLQPGDGRAVRADVGVRGTHRTGRSAGPVLRARAPRRESHHHARGVGTRQRVLQRLPSSGHEALHRGRGDVRRQHPVPVSRVDVRSRGTSRGRAAHGRGPALPEGRLPAAPRPLR